MASTAIQNVDTMFKWFSNKFIFLAYFFLYHSGGYYANHSNESSPTSPSVSGGSLNLQNSSMASTGCDCSQVSNVQDVTPTNAPTENPNDSSASSAPSSAASGESFKK